MTETPTLDLSPAATRLPGDRRDHFVTPDEVWEMWVSEGEAMLWFDRLATLVILVLGVGHTAFTPVFVPGLNQASIWFAGGGLALLFLGLFNVARLTTPAVTHLRRLCLVVNLIAFPWIVLVTVVVPDAPQPYIATVAILAVALCAFRPVRETQPQAA